MEPKRCTVVHFRSGERKEFSADWIVEFLGNWVLLSHHPTNPISKRQDYRGRVAYPTTDILRVECEGT